MARKKIERNISYDEERKRYYVNLDYGADPETESKSNGPKLLRNYPRRGLPCASTKPTVTGGLS